jgi:DDE superfamily endonuclease
MGNATSDWENELKRWLKPFVDRLGHKARRRMCPLYVAGLIGPGERKSIQPMAERFAAGDYDQLHHFIADGVWDATPLESELLNQADRLVGGIMGASQSVHNLGLHARSSPANEAIVAGRVRTEVFRQIAPWRSRSQDPEDAVKDAAVVYPRNATRLVRQHWLDSSPFIIGEFVAHDSSPGLGA